MSIIQEHSPSLFKGPNLGDALDNKTKFSPIEFRQTFVNNLGVPVTLFWRNGMQFELPPVPDHRSNSLIVRIHINVKAAGYKSMANFLATVDDKSQAELKMIRDAFRNKGDIKFYRGGEIVLDYPVTLGELQDMGGAVYYHEIDTVVALDSVKDKIYHPYSEEGMANQVAVGVPLKKHEAGFTYFITIVDNSGQRGPRFANINRKVYQINPIKDIRRRDGIYIVSNHSVSGSSQERGLERRFYPFGDNEEKLGLWTSYDSAVDGGDVSLAARRELAAQEETIKRLSLERQELEQRNAMELANVERAAKEREAVLNREKQELERARAEAEFQEKQRRAALNDHYEQRSHERKDYSEGLKFLPTLLIGLGAVAGFFLRK